jgi:NADPH:quinone reductase-like Zn-dependent oxidoreductase
MKFEPTDTILCTDKRDWAVEAQRLTAGHGVDHVFDIGGAATIEKSIEAVAFGGAISFFDCLSPGIQDRMPNVVQLALRKGVKMRAVLHGSKQQLDEVIGFIAAHNLRVPVEKTFHFERDRVVEAYNYLADGQHIGKVCIEF